MYKQFNIVNNRNIKLVRHKIPKINLGEKFDTTSVKSMRNMLMEAEVETIDLGNKFNMDNTEYTDNMFRDCAAKQIIVGATVSDITVEKLKELTNIPVLQR